MNGILFDEGADKMVGFLNRNFDYYAGIACKYSLMDKMVNLAGGNVSIEPDLCLFAYFLSYRDLVAQTVAERHPAFTQTAARVKKNVIEGNNSREALAEELDMASIFCNTPGICCDTDYLVLMFAWISCLGPNSEEEKSTQSRILEQLDEADNIEGVSNIILSAALWFSDFNGFRAAVYERFKRSKAELCRTRILQGFRS